MKEEKREREKADAREGKKVRGRRQEINESGKGKIKGRRGGRRERRDNEERKEGGREGMTENRMIGRREGKGEEV